MSHYDQFSSQTRIISLKSHTIMLHIIYSISSAEKVSFVITAINFCYSSSGATTTISLIIYYIITALCGLCLHNSLKHRITSAQYNKIDKFPIWLYARSMNNKN
jgi:hypothetical protein